MSAASSVSIDDLAQKMGTPFIDVRWVSKEIVSELRLVMAYQVGHAIDLVANDLSSSLRVANMQEPDSNCFTSMHKNGRTFVAYDCTKAFSPGKSPQQDSPVPIFEVIVAGDGLVGQPAIHKASININPLRKRAGSHDVSTLLRAYAQRLESHREYLHS